MQLSIPGCTSKENISYTEFDPKKIVVTCELKNENPKVRLRKKKIVFEHFCTI